MADVMHQLPPQFLTWRIADIEGKKVKIPTDVLGFSVDVKDRSKWLSYEQAVATGRPIAFVLSENDPYFFIDLDDCLEPGGWSAEAQAICQRFAGAAIEVSQSGTGLHIIGRCDKSAIGERRNRWEGWKEFYIKDRFIAFGGHGWHGNPDVDCTEAIRGFVPERAAKRVSDVPRGVSAVPDELVVAKMLASQSGLAGFGNAKARAVDLWHANAGVLSLIYPGRKPGEFNQSQADSALLSHLAFWCNRDAVQMERLFGMSQLGKRDKWQEREDYREHSIDGALNVVKNVYKWPTMATTDAGVLSVNGFLTTTEVVKHFEGCVYISSLHAVLIPSGRIVPPAVFKVLFGGFEFSMQLDNARPTKDAFEAFTNNRAHKFPKVYTTCFRPDLPFGEIVDDAVNVYRDPGVPCVEGDVTIFLDHMRRLLPIDQDRNALLDYMATVVQRPGHKLTWAPVLQGVEGNGKSFIVECLVQAIGAQYCHSPKSEELGEKYNGWLMNNVLITVEEVSLKGRRDLLNILKPAITNTRLEIRLMGADKFMADVFCNWFFTTNFKDAMIKERNDRRYAMFFTAQQAEEDLTRDGMDESYFNRLFSWAKDGGYANITYYLKNRKVMHVMSRAPATSSTAEAIEASYGIVEQLIIDAVAADLPGFRGGYLSSTMVNNLLRDNRITIPGPNNMKRVYDNLGYVNLGRCGRIIMEENYPGRSRIYGKAGHNLTIDGYFDAQGWKTRPVVAFGRL